MKLLLPVRTLGSGKGRGRKEPKASLWHLHSLLSEVGRVGACSWRGESRARGTWLHSVDRVLSGQRGMDAVEEKPE